MEATMSWTETARRDHARRGLRYSSDLTDSQSVKTTESGGVRGFDAGKKINGRKRHIVTDTLGHLVGLVVHGADVQDRDGASRSWPRSAIAIPGCVTSSPMAGTAATN
jgi:hypothetical protein